MTMAAGRQGGTRVVSSCLIGSVQVTENWALAKRQDVRILTDGSQLKIQYGPLASFTSLLARCKDNFNQKHDVCRNAA